MSPLQQLSGRGDWPYATQVAEPASDNTRPAGQLVLSLFSILVSLIVAIALAFESSSGMFCTTIAQRSGANITDAAALLMLGGFAAIFFAIVVRNHARLLRAVLLGEAAMVGLSVGLVARDSATARMTEDCGFFSSNVSTATQHVQYAYVVLGLVLAVILMQAFRGWDRTPRRTAGTIACVVAVALLAVVAPGQASRTQRSAASRPPKGVLVCRAFLAPKALGGPQCDPQADVGRAPIRAQGGLMCETLLRGVRGKMIGIQVFHDGTVIRHATLRSSDSETSPYVYFDSNWVHGATGSRLPTGRYRCRFLVNDRVVRSRAITVARRLFTRSSGAQGPRGEAPSGSRIRADGHMPHHSARRPRRGRQEHDRLRG